jgi:hypothetical protein
MANDQYLAGKLAIVTGASKANGIGAATAYSLASHGANVNDLLLSLHSFFFFVLLQSQLIFPRLSFTMAEMVPPLPKQ